MTEGGYVEGRFMKVAGAMTIREAVMAEPVTISGYKILWIDFGDAIRINDRLGFGWLAHTKEHDPKHSSPLGEVRTTKDSEAHTFWGIDYIQTWEYGGHAGGNITVTPRDPDGSLSPRPGVSVKQVTHSIPKVGMFGRGYTSSAHTLRNFIFSELHQKVRNLDRRRAI
jgi:hypothetical protein